MENIGNEERVVEQWSNTSGGLQLNPLKPTANKCSRKSILFQCSDLSAQPTPAPLSQPSTMDAKSQRTKRQDNALSLLNAAIEAMNLAKELSSMTPTKAVFGSVSILLTMIRVCPFLFEDAL